MMTWQPIETAPKDGRSIILAGAHSVFSGFWHVGRNGKWTDEQLRERDPMYWMPFPKPPEAP